MNAASASAVDVPATRRLAAVGRPTAACPPPQPASVLVTVQISVAGGDPSPATAGLVEHLRGLIAEAAEARLDATVVDGRAVDGIAVDGRVMDADPPVIPPARLRPVSRLPGQRSPHLLVHQASRSVYRDRVPVHLTRREYDLFVFLARHPRRVFTRPQLLRQVWGYEPAAGERTVDVHVRRLRTKLEGYPPVIATVRGVGYRLAESVHVTLQPETD